LLKGKAVFYPIKPGFPLDFKNIGQRIRDPSRYQEEKGGIGMPGLLMALIYGFLMTKVKSHF